MKHKSTVIFLLLCLVRLNSFGEVRNIGIDIIANSSKACIRIEHKMENKTGIGKIDYDCQLPVNKVGIAIFVNEVDSFPEIANGTKPKTLIKYQGGVQCIYNDVAYTKNSSEVLTPFIFASVTNLSPEKKYFVKVYKYHLDSLFYYNTFTHWRKFRSAQAAFYTRPKTTTNINAGTYANSKGGKLVISDINVISETSYGDEPWLDYGKQEGYETRIDYEGNERLLVFQPAVTRQGLWDQASVKYRSPNNFNYSIRLTNEAPCDFVTGGKVTCDKRSAMDTIDKALYSMPYLSFYNNNYFMCDTLFLRIDNQTRFKLNNLSAYSCLTSSFDSVFVLSKTELPSFVDETVRKNQSAKPFHLNDFLAKYQEYPSSAKAIGMKGDVFVDCYVDKEGNILRVTTTGNSLKASNSTDSSVINAVIGEVKQSALKLAVKLPLFYPLIKNGNPVFSIHKLTLNY